MTYADGTLFLEEVIEKLKNRLAEIGRNILEGEKEVENMHEYYWENYTEMDQYGYEDFDNQQALLNQINANQETLLLKQRIERMLDAPFFGRIDFVFEGEDAPEIFYIGIANFSETTGGTPLIYDWRAPVSGLFYDFDKGPAFYEAPGGHIKGEIASKWQYKIKEGKMIYSFESDIKIDDDILKQELGSHGETSLKNIVRTIQKEQNAIIRNTKDKILVIQGAAGSGKTSIALHRIAYLLYHDRKNLKSSDILILSPNSVFSDYIAHILPELGEENIREMSFDLFAYHELKDIAPDCEDRYHQLERRTDMERFREKQSFEFIGQTESFLAILEDELVDFHEIDLKGFKYTEEFLIDLFYFKFQEIPLLARMDSIREHFMDAFETLRGRTVTEEESVFLERQFDSIYVTKDIYKIYNRLMEEINYPILPDLPYEKRFIRYEDVFPMLYLKYRLTGTGRRHKIKHLVIDEMQDYSYLQYVILEKLFSCRMTILGDRAQTMDDCTQDVLTFLPKILGKDIKKIILNKSYRSTVEIAEYASRLTDLPTPELFRRHGKPVEEKCFSSLKDALENVVLSHETAAVLTRTEEEAKEAYRLLEQIGQKANYIDRDSRSFEKGLTVTTFYMAKGLEFDQVYAIRNEDGADHDTSFFRQADYICATRALHELYMFTIRKEDAVK